MSDYNFKAESILEPLTESNLKFLTYRIPENNHYNSIKPLSFELIYVSEVMDN